MGKWIPNFTKCVFLVAIDLPIFFRCVIEGLQEKVQEEIEKSILRSQVPPYRDGKQ